MSNIKVAVRVRPLIQREIDSKEPQYWVVKKNTICLDSDDKSGCSYTFDHVFDQKATNAQVYQECCHPIVKSVMNGFNGTIFAYGQTSSGKTHSMFGSPNEPGLVQLAVSNIFNIIENVPEREYLLRISYMEIYNETLYDLLDRTEGKVLQIREGLEGQPFVANVMEITVSSPEAILKTMKAGEKLRHVGETDMNSRSSRSHTLFRMVVESSLRDEDVDRVVTVSQLNLVDLAGSERMEQAGTTGNRFREGVHINVSLSVLSQVISKLSRGERGHINYRDSKLTRILQNSLGGNAHTAIICNVTPASLQQTHCTLRFASSAKKIQNKPVINEVISDSALLRRYHHQMEQLQIRIKEMEAQNLDKKLEEKNSTIEELQEKVRLLREQLVVSTHPAPRLPSKLSRRQRRETWAAPRAPRATPSHRRYRAPVLSPVAEGQATDDSPFFVGQRPLIPTKSLDDNFVAVELADFERHLIQEEKRRLTRAADECISPLCERTQCQENLSRVAFLENEVALLTKELEELREMTSLERLCCNSSRKRRRTEGDLIDLLADGSSPCLPKETNTPLSPDLLGSFILTGKNSVSSFIMRCDDLLSEANENKAEIQVTEQTAVGAGTMVEACNFPSLTSKDAATETAPLVCRGTADKETSTDIVQTVTSVGAEVRETEAASTVRRGAESGRMAVEDVASQTEPAEGPDSPRITPVCPRTVDVGTGMTSSEITTEITALSLGPLMRDQETHTDVIRLEVKDAASETKRVEMADFSAVAVIGLDTVDQEIMTDITALDFPAKPEVKNVGLDARKIETTDFSAVVLIRPSVTDRWTVTDVAAGLATKAEMKDAASEMEKLETTDFGAVAVIQPDSIERGMLTDALQLETKASGTDRVETVDFSAVASIQPSRSDCGTTTDVCQMVSTAVCAIPDVRDAASRTTTVETADFSMVVSIRPDTIDRDTSTDVFQTVSTGVCVKPAVRDSASGTVAAETADFSMVVSIRPDNVDQDTSTDAFQTVSTGVCAKPTVRDSTSETVVVEAADFSMVVSIRPDSTDQDTSTDLYRTVSAGICAKPDVRDSASGTAAVKTADFSATARIPSCGVDQETTTDVCQMVSTGITARTSARSVGIETKEVKTADFCCGAQIRLSNTDRSTSTELFSSSSSDACVLARCETREVALATVETAKADFGVTTCIKSKTRDQYAITDIPPVKNKETTCCIMPAVRDFATSLNRRHFDRDAGMQTEDKAMVDKSTCVDLCFSPSRGKQPSMEAPFASSRQSSVVASATVKRMSTWKTNATADTSLRENHVDDYFAPFIEHVEKCGSVRDIHTCRCARRVDKAEKETSKRHEHGSKFGESGGLAECLEPVKRSTAEICLGSRTAAGGFERLSEHIERNATRREHHEPCKTAATTKDGGFKRFARLQTGAQKQGANECSNGFERFIEHVEQVAQNENRPSSEGSGGLSTNVASRQSTGVQTVHTQPDEVVELRNTVERQRKRIQDLEKGCRHKEADTKSDSPPGVQRSPRKAATAQGGHLNPLRELRGDERNLALMSPGSREEELIMRVARTLPGRGDNMVIESLTAQLNHKNMQLENLQRRFLMLSSRSKKGTCSQASTRDAATSPQKSEKENILRGGEDIIMKNAWL